MRITRTVFLLFHASLLLTGLVLAGTSGDESVKEVDPELVDDLTREIVRSLPPLDGRAELEQIKPPDVMMQVTVGIYPELVKCYPTEGFVLTWFRGSGASAMRLEISHKRIGGKTCIRRHVSRLLGEGVEPIASSLTARIPSSNCLVRSEDHPELIELGKEFNEIELPRPFIDDPIAMGGSPFVLTVESASGGTLAFESSLGAGTQQRSKFMSWLNQILEMLDSECD